MADKYESEIMRLLALCDGSWEKLARSIFEDRFRQ